MAVTQKEIARLLGVSQRTVSAALTGNNRVGEELKEKIQTVARAMGYRAHAAARAIKTGRHLTLGLVFHSEQSFFSRDLIKAIADTTEKAGMNLLFSMVPKEQLNDLKTPLVAKIFTEHCVDGFLISTARQMPRSLLLSIHAQGIPAVWIDTADDCDCVYADEYGGARKAVELLCEHGHRRIDFVTYLEPAAKYPSSEHLGTHVDIDREAGYRDAMSDFGLRPRVHAAGLEWWDGWPSTDTGKRLEWALGLLREKKLPTAFVCRSEKEAAPLLVAARQSGLTVPGDLSLVCMAPEIVNSCGLPITTVVTNFAELGREAVRCLVRRIEDPESPLPSLAVGCEIIAGLTVGPPE